MGVPLKANMRVIVFSRETEARPIRQRHLFQQRFNRCVVTNQRARRTHGMYIPPLTWSVSPVM
jgi:hypothetical protein